AIKTAIIGPLTYLWLGKSKDNGNKLDLLPRLLPVYKQLLDTLAAQGVEWVQIDEPALVTELDAGWQQAYRSAYQALATDKVNLLLATYFGPLLDNLALVQQLPVQGLHIDAVSGREEVAKVVESLPAQRVLSLGVISGRNIWKTDLTATLDWLEPIHAQLKDRLWLAPSCSLLHVPVVLASEEALDAEIRSWLAFALQKLEELRIVAAALNHGRESVAEALARNQDAIRSRRASTRVHNAAVRAAVEKIDAKLGQRKSPYSERAEKQSGLLGLPAYP